MSGVIVFAMGVVIVVLLCALTHNMAERMHENTCRRFAESKCDDLQKTLDAGNYELRVLRSEVNDLRRKHEDYERMAAEIKSAIARHKPITDDEIPF